MIGIVGGVGPHAGLHLHKRIMDLTEYNCDQDHLPVLHINCASEIPDRSDFILGKFSENPSVSLIKQLQTLSDAGARVVGIPCNTAHSAIIYDDILIQMQKKPELILVDMLDELFSAIVRSGEERIGLLATLGSYKSGVFFQYANKHNIDVIMPDYKIQLEIHDSVYNKKEGLKAKGIMNDRIHSLYLDIFEQYRRKDIESVILGCTEISMVSSFIKVSNIQFYKTVDILAEALIREYLKYVKGIHLEK